MNTNAREFDFRRPTMQRVMLTFAVVVFCPLMITMAAVATALLLSREYLLAAAIAGIAWLMFPIVRFFLSEVQAAWRWRVRIAVDRIDLRLPAHRSHAHDTPAFIRSLHSSEIAAIFTREETYRKFCIVNVFRVYALQLTSGEFVFLGEDLAEGPARTTSFALETVDTLRTTFSIPMHELPAVIGKSGYLGIVNNEAPEWDDAGMSESQLEKLAQDTERSNTIMAFVYLAVGIMSAIRFLA